MEEDKLPENNKLTIIHREVRQSWSQQSIDNKREISLFKVSNVANLVNPCL